VISAQCNSDERTLPPFVNLLYFSFDSATFRVAFVSPGIIAKQEGMKVLVLSPLHHIHEIS